MVTVQEDVQMTVLLVVPEDAVMGALEVVDLLVEPPVKPVVTVEDAHLLVIQDAQIAAEVVVLVLVMHVAVLVMVTVEKNVVADVKVVAM